MKCAVIQMTSGRNVDANLQSAFSLIKNAAQQGARLVVLPEMFACLGVTSQFELASNRFTEKGVLAELASWSHQFEIFLVAGSVPMVPELSDDKTDIDKVSAACIVFSPEGKVLTQYNKIHLFDVDVVDEKGRYRESDTFVAGDAVKSVMVDDHNLGLSICYDLRFPELYQRLQAEGCEIITVPSAFTFATGRQHWEVLLRARAIETQSFVLAANQGGVHEDGRRTWGHSMIVSPTGEILAQADTESEQVVCAELDFSVLNQVRQSMPIIQHKKI